MSEIQDQSNVVSDVQIATPNTEVSIQSSSPENNIRVIKKYQNRKLYDTQDSCYITFKEVLELVVNGSEVLILDNNTKKDITDSAILSSLSEYTKNLSSSEICNILSVVGKFIKARGERNGI